MSPDLELALALADAADALSLPRFRTGSRSRRSPTSRRSPRRIALSRRNCGASWHSERPDDAILGEEQGAAGSGARRWILDPIDGTRNYARGIPVWATLSRWRRAASCEVGVVSAPALGRRWWADRGAGAFANGEQIRVSAIAAVEEAVLSFAIEAKIPELARRAWHPRGLGDFWAHMLVAEGAVDGAVDAPGVSEWDLAAVQVIVEEAGGRFTDFAGEPRIDTGTAVISNGLLHDELLAAVEAP